MDLYKKEISESIKPFKIGKIYANWKFESVILKRRGFFYLDEIILRFINNSNDFRIFFKIINQGFNFRYQILSPDPLAKNIYQIIKKIFFSKTKIIKSTFFYLALTQDGNIFKKIIFCKNEKIVEFFNYNKIKIENKFGFGSENILTSLSSTERLRIYKMAELLIQTSKSMFFLKIKNANKDFNFALKKIYEVILQIRNFSGSISEAENIISKTFQLKSENEDCKFRKFFNKNFLCYCQIYDPDNCIFELVKDYLVDTSIKQRSSPHLDIKQYAAVIIINYHLDACGIGDMLINSNKSVFKFLESKDIYIVTDLIPFYTNSPYYKAIYNDLLFCFIENKLFKKKVLILDINEKKVNLDNKVKDGYYLFLYRQYYQLFKGLGLELDFKGYFSDPVSGLKYLKKEIKSKYIDILDIKEDLEKSLKLYVSNKLNLILGNILSKDKKIIGICANYPISHAKGWEVKNWINLIDLINGNFSGIQFVLLPVNIHTFYDLNTANSEFNYHDVIYNQLKNKVDIVDLDQSFKDYIFKNNFYQDYFQFKFGSLEFLKSSISLCDLVIALDSGPAHISASLNVPVLSLFSSGGNILANKPFGSNSYALFKTFSGKKIREDYLNINFIKPSEVFAFIKKIKILA